MDFRLFHPPLPVLVVEAFKHVLKGVIWIVHHVGKRPALTITEEVLWRKGHSRFFESWVRHRLIC